MPDLTKVGVKVKAWLGNIMHRAQSQKEKVRDEKRVGNRSKDLERFMEEDPYGIYIEEDENTKKEE